VARRFGSLAFYRNFNKFTEEGATFALDSFRALAVFAALELAALVLQPLLVQLVAVMRIYRLLGICI